MESSFNELPHDLLLKIFLLQPMNSLVHLRNVCKFWDQIISSEYFNELRLARERTSSNTNKYLMFEGFRGSKSTSLVDIDKYMYHNIYVKDYECYGICDGLLCLAPAPDSLKAQSKIILWNPVFRKILPKLDIKDSEITFLCFGYHDDDYKVIRVVVFSFKYYVCIYSLSTNSWKVLEFDGNINPSISSHEYMSWSLSEGYLKGSWLVNGTAYFLWYHDIISFDLSSEMFREPIYCNYFYNAYSEFILEEYRESLILLGSIHRGNDLEWRSFDVFVSMWVLRESDNSFSWDEIILFQGESNRKYQPVGFMNTDEVVIRSTMPDTIHKYSFFLWNVENSSVRSFSSATMVQSSSNVESFIRVGSKDEVSRCMKPIHAPCRKPQKPERNKLVASSSNSYAALADFCDDLLNEDM